MAPDASSDVTPNAKQLVFLFMAATVVAVVVFLCGVLVGRGVPLRSSGVKGPLGVSSPRFADRQTAVESTSRATFATAAEGAELSYPERLESDAPMDESFQPPDGGLGDTPPQPTEPPSTIVEPVNDDDGTIVTTPRSAGPGPGASPGVNDLAPARPTAVAAEVLASELAALVSPPVQAPREADGFKIQVGAYRAEGAARQVAETLTGQGFPAYVRDPAADAPVAVYRVRVGPYADQAEAERVRQRLEQEHQFRPWVTR
jgi:DedD protein